MKTNWQELHETFYANMNLAMYQWLAEHLGVSVDALMELQIGWVPFVVMSKGPSYGWFSIPQRNENGVLTGLALRNRDGDKVVYPGTKAGCVYVINPKHKKGSERYVSGAHNWVRAGKGDLCPVCGKPDGCLLSADDPTDPSAVLCRVVVSDRPVRKSNPPTWLHIRKADGDISGEPLLAGSGPVLVVEGMSDVAAAMTLGYTAIGRPSNVGGQKEVAELIRGRPLIVMGENDRKPNGHWPGQDGMLAHYQNAKGMASSAKMLMPPDTIKDLRSWVVKNGLTGQQFAEYAEKKGVEAISELVLDNDNPLTIATRFLKDSFPHGKKHYLLRRWEDCWYRYDREAGKYSMVRDPELRQPFILWTENKQYQSEGSKGVEMHPLIYKTEMWGNFTHAAEARVLLPDKTVPAWINGKTGPEPKDLIVFNNGILNATEYATTNESDLLPPTPDFFNTTALPLPFDPEATCPRWLAFLGESIGDEQAKIDLLQEWIGYCLTPDTSQQKLMYFRGESGSGKGTILRVLQSLVGNGQSASSSLSQLSESFGLQPLIGKLICIIGDARLSRHTDAMRGLEVLLGMTGGDAMQINRKFKDQLEGTFLTARITIASNDFLEVPDSAGAMLRRLNVIQFSRSFKDNPDVHLSDKLAEELEGIAVWALQGLRRLRTAGWTVPASSKAALAEWERDTNPMQGWLQDCTRRQPEGVTMKDMLYDCWAAWCKDSQRSVGSRTLFLRKLASNAGYTLDAGTGIKGIDLLPHVGKRYLGKP